MKKILLFLFALLFCFAFNRIAYSANANRYIVLVLDTSGSMWGNPVEVQKEAAKSFCQKLLKADGNNYAAVVRLDSHSSVLCDFTDNLTSLDNCIDSIYASGGTNTNDALVVAGQLLASVNVQGAIKNIVLCSDGLPESGLTSDTGQYTYEDHPYCYPYANVAYKTAESLKENYKIFTLGFFHSLSDSELEFGKRFMSDIASDNSYYEITNVEDLVITFGEVADDVLTNDKNPIIVIPGIMGSRLFMSDTVFDDSTRVWDPVITGNNILENLSSPGLTQLNERMEMSNTLYVRPCENQNIDVNDSKNSGNNVIIYGREYGATDAYKKLVDRLCDVYSVGKGNYRPVYFFSYDWRKSNTESAKRLNECIQIILEETGAEKVNLICHSMGGLVASKYYVEYGSKEQVDTIITCGTPYEGAPKLINSVMNWDILGEGNDLINNENDRNDFGLGLDLFGLFGGGMQRKLKASFNGVAELVPTENYINAFPMSKNEWNSPISWATYQLTFTKYQEICRKMLSDTGYNAAYKFQESLKDSGYNKLLKYNKSYFVLGINQRTISAVKYKLIPRLDGAYDIDDLAYNTKGDGTVPYYSASISEQLENFDSNRVFRYSTNHGGVVEENDCLEWILAKLNHSTSSVSSDILRSAPFIVIRIACPVDVTINNGDESLSSSPEIFSRSASFGCIDIVGESDDIKLLCLDNSPDISLVMNGTAEGTMDYAIRFFDENGKNYKEDTFENIPVTEDTIIQTETDESKPTVLKIDKDGDGTFDDYIVPSSSKGDFNVTLQPTDLYVEIGKSATFKVATDADSPVYQWYVNYNDGEGWSSISGATNSEYIISQVSQSNDGNQYQCLITNNTGHALSSKVAVLHVSNSGNSGNSGNSNNVSSSSSGCASFNVAGFCLLLVIILGKANFKSLSSQKIKKT